ncbi:ACT11D09.5 [Cucumis melo var. makuwa]|uniref:ACT11D09.5 n=1 Tax=Cucumis melo var. makuwa TaxID=1194695 RepID=A0A5A7T4N2_CUCMM|nr:ACT11D09.5 [Cucumis melo var. makuwa]
MTSESSVSSIPCKTDDDLLAEEKDKREDAKVDLSQPLFRGIDCRQYPCLVCKCIEKYMKIFWSVEVDEGSGSHLVSWEVMGRLALWSSFLSEFGVSYVGHQSVRVMMKEFLLHPPFEEKGRFLWLAGGGYLAPIAPLPLEGKVTSGKNLELFLGYVKVRGVYVVILVLIDAGREIWGGRSTKEYEEVNS